MSLLGWFQFKWKGLPATDFEPRGKWALDPAERFVATAVPFERIRVGNRWITRWKGEYPTREQLAADGVNTNEDGSFVSAVDEMIWLQAVDQLIELEGE